MSTPSKVLPLHYGIVLSLRLGSYSSTQVLTVEIHYLDDEDELACC